MGDIIGIVRATAIFDLVSELVKKRKKKKKQNNKKQKKQKKTKKKKKKKKRKNKGTGNKKAKKDKKKRNYFITWLMPSRPCASRFLVVPIVFIRCSHDFLFFPFF